MFECTVCWGEGENKHKYGDCWTTVHKKKIILEGGLWGGGGGGGDVERRWGTSLRLLDGSEKKEWSSPMARR